MWKRSPTREAVRTRPTTRVRPRRSATADEASTPAGVRIQKYLSRAGVASRRQAEELMVQGRVRVNGRVVTSLGSRVRVGDDRIEVDGRVVEPEPFRWVAVHKEPGTVTTADDPHGRPTVYDDLPEELEGLAYVGRLDLDTSGLLLLSNEGDAIHRMLHPSFEVDREYEATVGGTPDRRALDRLTSGVELEDGVARAVEAELLPADVGSRGDAVVRLVLREGRKREVRRMLDEVGHPVRTLRRIRFGPIRLGDLEPGAWRELTTQEVRAIRTRVGLTDDGERTDHEQR